MKDVGKIREKALKENQQRVDRLLKRAQQICHQNPQKGVLFAELAWHIAKKHELELKSANIAKCMGYCYFKLTQYQKATKQYLFAVKIFIKHKNFQTAAQIYTNLSTIYLTDFEDSKALKSALTALTLFKKIKDQKGMSNAHLNLGVIYKNQGKFEEGLKHTQKARDLKKLLKEEKGIEASQENIQNNKELQKVYKAKKGST